MTTTLQYVLVAFIAGVCLLFVIRSQLPGTWRKASGHIALWALREGHPDWLKRLGRKIAPAAGASTGCGGCDTDCH